MNASSDNSDSIVRPRPFFEVAFAFEPDFDYEDWNTDVCAVYKHKFADPTFLARAEEFPFEPEEVEILKVECLEDENSIVVHMRGPTSMYGALSEYNLRNKRELRQYIRDAINGYANAGDEPNLLMDPETGRGFLIYRESKPKYLGPYMKNISKKAWNIRKTAIQMRKMVRNSRSTQKAQKGGQPIPMPSPYLGKIPGIVQPNAAPGQDLALPTNQIVRRFLPEMQGGFSPSIMEPFARSAAQYATPMALYSGYKFMTRNRTKRSTRRNRRRSSRNRRRN